MAVPATLPPPPFEGNFGCKHGCAPTATIATKTEPVTNKMAFVRVDPAGHIDHMPTDPLLSGFIAFNHEHWTHTPFPGSEVKLPNEQLHMLLERFNASNHTWDDLHDAANATVDAFTDTQWSYIPQPPSADTLANLIALILTRLGPVTHDWTPPERALHVACAALNDSSDALDSATDDTALLEAPAMYCERRGVHAFCDRTQTFIKPMELFWLCPHGWAELPQ